MTLDRVHPRAEADGHLDQSKQQTEFGPWLTSRECLLYIPCASLNAFYQWKKRHGIVARGNGSVAKRDLDRILRRRSARGRHPNSLRNLRSRVV